MPDRANGLTKANIQRIYPLRPLQEGMLYHALKEPRSWAYFEQTWIRLRGAFDAERCRRAWETLVERHEALRSAFLFEGASQPLRIALKTRPPDFSTRDLTSFAPEKQEAFLETFRREDRDRGFDLLNDALLRITLFRLDVQRFELVISHPHIILDGWSGGVIQSEFLQIYRALGESRAPNLPPLASYDEYLDCLERRGLDDARRYWIEYLAGFETPSTVPTMPSSASANPDQYDPRGYNFLLDETASANLAAIAARHGATLNTALQCLWAILLSRWNNTDDTLFGTIVSGRLPDVEGMDAMAGLFINTIPVRFRLREGMTFAELLRRAQADAAESALRDHFALAEIQAAFPDRRALLDHLFVFENYPLDERLNAVCGANDGGFEVESVGRFEQAHYHFGVLAHPGERIAIHFSYDGVRYAEDHVRRLASHYQTAVASLPLDGDILLDDIPILPQDEARRILIDFAGPIRPYPEEKTIADLWEEQAQATPDAFAIITPNESLTYRELDERANALAAFLLERISLQPDDRVGVYLPRGAEVITALLAILKTGAAYMPLDPAYPEERIRFMLRDSGCRAVVTDAEVGQRLAAISSVPRIEVDACARNLRRVERQASSRDIAYVIYTSGSTGQPKGVLVEHRGFVNMILEQIRGFGLHPGDRVMQFASLSFDASLSEIFMALLSGAALIMEREENLRDPEQLRQRMAHHGATVITLPPAFLRAMDGGDLPSLRALVLAGEAIHADDARRRARSMRVFNGYGPTEASVCAAYHEVAPDSDDPLGIPIGRSLPNNALRILDRRLRPVPIGVPGEICMAGVGVARGYLNRREETQARFIDSPLTGDARLYRSGDLGCWLPNGDVVFLGRIDEQVKIHGHRVELGEIERQLTRLDGVEQAAVAVIEDSFGGKRLAAYLSGAKRLDLDAVRGELARALPAYMVPAYFTQLDEMPLTPNLKIDRKALPLPEFDQRTDAYVSPRTERESAMAALWAETLGLERVGVQDDFESLGGDSIKAIQLVNRMRKAGFSTTLRDLYEARTVAALCAVRQEESNPSAIHESIPIRLTPTQRRFFESCRTDRNLLVHTACLRTHVRLDERALRLALAELQRVHDALRWRFSSSTDIPTPSVVSDPPVDLSLMDLCGFDDPDSERERDLDRRRRELDIEAGPLMKAVIYRSPNEDRLLLLVHHLAVDLVSWRILLEDLADAYAQSCRGESVQLTAPTASYAAWSNALARYAESGALEAEAPYWRDILSARVASNPYDRPQSDGGRRDRSIIVVREIDFAALGDAQTETILLAALASALREWSGGERHCILRTHHGRLSSIPGVDISRTVGWFTCYHPLLLESPASAEPEKLLGGVQRELDRLPNRGLGYDLLRCYLSEESLNDDCELRFNYLGSIGHWKLGEPFQLDLDASNAYVGPGMERPHRLEIEAMRLQNTLRVEMAFDPTAHPQAEVEFFLDKLTDALHQVDEYLHNALAH